MLLCTDAAFDWLVGCGIFATAQVRRCLGNYKIRHLSTQTVHINYHSFWPAPVALGAIFTAAIFTIVFVDCIHQLLHLVEFWLVVVVISPCCRLCCLILQHATQSAHSQSVRHVGRNCHMHRICRMCSIIYRMVASSINEVHHGVMCPLLFSTALEEFVDGHDLLVGEYRSMVHEACMKIHGSRSSQYRQQ